MCQRSFQCRGGSRNFVTSTTQLLTTLVNIWKPATNDGIQGTSKTKAESTWHKEVSIQTAKHYFALAFHRDSKSTKYIIKSYNLISPMTRRVFLETTVWQNTKFKLFLYQMNLKPTAVVKTIHAVKISQITTHMIERKFENPV